MGDWHIITSEYPPQAGGVSDYTKLIANGLAAAGDEVNVWCPASPALTRDAETNTENSSLVTVHRDFGRFSPADLRRVGRSLDQMSAPRRLLVQWVPQGYGYRSVNLPFCFWLWSRANVKHDRVELMVHEPFLPFREGSRKQDLAAAAHRLMITVLLRAASQVWVSIPEWETHLRPFVRGNKSFGWLPVPSTIPIVADAEGIAGVRAQYASAGRQLVGHFGAYDRYMTELMLELLPLLLKEQNNLSVVLIGKGSLELRARLVALHPEVSEAVYATGALSAAEISKHLSACDVMLQPYQDGVSGRRTSVMTALSHGIPVVTNEGKATENCWSESEGVRLIQLGDVSGTVEAVHGLLANEDLRKSLGTSGAKLYRKRFEIQQTISALRDAHQNTLKPSECPA